MMHGHEKSDSVIVAAKPANKVARPAVKQTAAEPATAEPVEPRAETKGNADQQSTCRAQSRISVSQALERIRKVARERKKERFTALFHHISIDLLEEAFYELKEDAAPGVDRLTWTDYEADLECKLEDLHDRVQRGAYRRAPRLVPRILGINALKGGDGSTCDEVNQPSISMRRRRSSPMNRIAAALSQITHTSKTIASLQFASLSVRALQGREMRMIAPFSTYWYIEMRRTWPRSHRGPSRRKSRRRTGPTRAASCAFRRGGTQEEREWACGTAAAHIASKDRYMVPNSRRYFRQQLLISA
jgi:hypothetical protein